MQPILRGGGETGRRDNDRQTMARQTMVRQQMHGRQREGNECCEKHKGDGFLHRRPSATATPVRQRREPQPVYPLARNLSTIFDEKPPTTGRGAHQSGESLAGPGLRWASANAGRGPLACESYNRVSWVVSRQISSFNTVAAHADDCSNARANHVRQNLGRPRRARRSRASRRSCTSICTWSTKSPAPRRSRACGSPAARCAGPN